MTTPSTRTAAPGRPAAWILADALLIIAFAAIGRLSHGEGLGGLAQTSWPFLAGGLVGWLVSLGWRRPGRIIPTGAAVWLCTVVVGMALRAVSGQGVAVSFVIVTLIVTGLFLVGSRAVVGLVTRRVARH